MARTSKAAAAKAETSTQNTSLEVPVADHVSKKPRRRNVRVVAAPKDEMEGPVEPQLENKAKKIRIRVKIAKNVSHIDA
jgi:hypothetical protein